MPGARRLKRQVADLLLSSVWRQNLAQLKNLPPKPLIRALVSLLPAEDQETKWRAVSALGEVVAHLSTKEPEQGREVLRRLMWSLNEESGAVGWGLPEAMAEIMYNSEVLGREYLNILISYASDGPNFLEFAPLLHGAVWGLGRMAQKMPEELKRRGADAVLACFLDSADAALRGLAAWGLVFLAAPGAEGKLIALTDDRSEISLWDDHQLNGRMVGDLARDALRRLSGRTMKQS